MKKRTTANRPKFQNTRKALRKQKRQEKKVHRKEHYLKKTTKDIIKVEQPKYTPGKFVKSPIDGPAPGTYVKKKTPNLQPLALDVLLRERKKEQKEVEKLNNAMEEQRRKIMVQDNEDEDKIIKKLEKQLGLNKSKNKNNYFADDGLDYLLEICDRATSEQIVAAEKHLADVDADSDFEEDLATVTGKETRSEKTKKKEKQHKKNKEIESEESISEKTNKTESKKKIEIDSEESNSEKTKKVKKESKKKNEIGSEESNIDSASEGEESHADVSEDDGLSDDDDEMGVYSDDDQQSDSDGPEEKPTNQKAKKSKQNNSNDKESKTHQSVLDSSKNKISKKERIVKADELSKVFSDDEISHLSGDDEDDEMVSGDEIDDDISDKKSDEKPDVWEDIYGRKRDKEGNVIKEEKGVYIPPHLRNKDSASEKDLAQLKRQVKSVLNKLAGSNLHWACTCIDNLYASNSRHSVNTVLTQLWTEACVGVTNTHDRLVCEHAALVCVLHANQATEVGAHFMEHLVKMFDELMKTQQPMADKRLDNVVACLAHLYNFKIYHAALLYDILSRLLEDITEKTIECVLVALRTVGGVLRKEEPVALRDFIHDTQGKVAKLNESATTGSRIKFLLEVLMAVKNNNLNKIPNYDPSYGEELKKSTRAIIRKGNYVTPLNVRLDDLLKADERGKWWIVGSAWEGSRELPKQEKAIVPTASKQLLELARQQRMNTDVRRTVFCTIMSAEDYMDAFEKLQHLGLKGQQEREIVHVLLACCVNEMQYNPYYAVLGQKLCDTHRKYQLSIQFSVWDKIKELETLPKHSLSNLAQFLVHLFMEKGLPLSVLKIIQFSDLNKRSLRFMRQILLSIIMNENLQSSLEVFHRISKAPKLRLFRESLRLFIQHFLIKNAGKSNKVISESEMVILKERAMEVDRVLTIYESKLKL